MEGHRIAEALARQSVDRVLNEADTRHQIINRLLHEVLSWPYETSSASKKFMPGTSILFCGIRLGGLYC